MSTRQVILESMGLSDLQVKDIQSTVDIYVQSKEILQRTKIALGREVNFEVINMTSTDNFKLPQNELRTTCKI